MARRKFTEAQKRRGWRKALKNPMVPNNFKRAIRRVLAKLAAKSA